MGKQTLRTPNLHGSLCDLEPRSGFSRCQKSVLGWHATEDDLLCGGRRFWWWIQTVMLWSGCTGCWRLECGAARSMRRGGLAGCSTSLSS